MRQLRHWWIVVSVVALCLVGCGERSLDNARAYPAKGKVALGGKPVCMGLVTLVPKSPGNTASPSGIIRADGTFTLRTWANQGAPDGGPPGEYTVVVTNYDPTESGPAPKDATPTPIPAKYSDAKTSGKTVTIKSGDNDLNIDLD
jgi:hypothetical protein